MGSKIKFQLFKGWILKNNNLERLKLKLTSFRRIKNIFKLFNFNICYYLLDLSDVNRFRK